MRRRVLWMPRLKRQEIAEELKFDLTPIYPSREEWAQDLQSLGEKGKELLIYRNRLNQGADLLIGFFQAQEEVDVLLQRVNMYPTLLLAADATSSVAQEMMGQVSAIEAKIKSATSFAVPEILQMSEDYLEEVIRTEPGMARFTNQIRKIVSERPHRLSEEQEALLAELEPSLHSQYDLYQTMMNADMSCEPILDKDGNEVSVSLDRYLFDLSKASDRDLRRAAYNSLSNGISHFKQTLAENYSNYVKKNVALAHVRNYESAIEMFLKPQNIPVSFYENTLDLIIGEAKPIARRYASLQKRVMGVEKIKTYDLHAPLSETKSPLSYSEACDLIQKALAPLGTEYGGILKSAFQEGWIDRADNVGKFPIPCSFDFYGVHPYVLTTWNNVISDAMILGHELGHAAHAELSSREQTIKGVDYEMIFAEVASTTNEWLLYHYLSESGSPDLKLQAARYLLEFDFSFFFGEVFLIEKLQSHLYHTAEEGRTLSSDEIYETYTGYLSELFGEDFEADDYTGLLWTYMPQPYMQTLYPYCYAVAFCVSSAIFDAILTEGQPAVDRYLAALKAGGTLPPLELMKMAGVDPLDPETFRRGIRRFEKVLDELEDLAIDKIDQ